MRRFYIFLFSLFTAVVSMAQEVPMDMTIVPPEQLGKGNRAPAQLPSVTYEDDNIYIYAPYYIDSMDVVVKDVSGNVIYTYASAMVAGKNTIVLPSSVSESKYSLEISYGSFHLIGYFWM